jgi:hypothetical protein
LTFPREMHEALDFSLFPLSGFQNFSADAAKFDVAFGGSVNRLRVTRRGTVAAVGRLGGRA